MLRNGNFVSFSIIPRSIRRCNYLHQEDFVSCTYIYNFMQFFIYNKKWEHSIAISSFNTPSVYCCVTITLANYWTLFFHFIIDAPKGESAIGSYLILIVIDFIFVNFLFQKLNIRLCGY